MDPNSFSFAWFVLFDSCPIRRSESDGIDLRRSVSVIATSRRLRTSDVTCHELRNGRRKRKEVKRRNVREDVHACEDGVGTKQGTRETERFVRGIGWRAWWREVRGMQKKDAESSARSYFPIPTRRTCCKSSSLSLQQCVRASRGPHRSYLEHRCSFRKHCA